MQLKQGFDNEKYLQMQSEKIRERIGKFDNKLYLEFGGKLFDDFHASRVLPGFQADSKLQMLLTMADQAEIVMVVSAEDIERNKEREDLGITYDIDVLRLIEEYRKRGLFIGSVVITKYMDTSSVRRFEEKLVTSGLRVYHHYLINGYPTNVPLVIRAPGPGSGKMSTCLSQLYHEHKRGINAGYAKFETFPIWNLPLDHPVNLAYEAATADLNDINMIDPYHLKAHGETTVNYNRDVEIFPLLYAMFQEIFGKSPYESPTDMGVNMAGYCIYDDEACKYASRQEIIRRYYHALAGVAEGKKEIEEVNKIRVLMSQEGLSVEDRAVVRAAQEREKETGDVATAIELDDGTIITGKTSDLLGPSAACLIKAIKHLAGLPKETKILSPESIAPIQKLKTQYLGSRNPRLHPDEVLVALSSNASKDADAALALDQLPKLKNCAVHTTAKLSAIDRRTFKRLGCDLTYDPKDL